jgi:ferritin-like metal-binding protein YciE
MKSMEELFYAQLQDTHFAEKQLLKALRIRKILL